MFYRNARADRLPHYSCILGLQEEEKCIGSAQLRYTHFTPPSSAPPHPLIFSAENGARSLRGRESDGPRRDGSSNKQKTFADAKKNTHGSRRGERKDDDAKG